MPDEDSNDQADTWIAALDGPETEHKAKGSRFIGQSFAVRDPETSKATLLTVKKRYYDACHHCSAYLIPPLDAPLERFDDDGEPSRTAGPPILQAIQSSGILGVLVVVTRYFGGTKLGTGGLIKAYGESARLALAATPTETIWLETTIELATSYEDVGCAESFLAQNAGQIRNVEREFADQARFLVTTARSHADKIVDGIREASAARIKTRIVGTQQ